MAAKEQFCDFCGEPLGTFAHSRRLEGPLICGSSECNREAAAADRADQDDARMRAEEDGYERYRGGW